MHLTDALLAGDAILGGVGRGLTDRHGDGEADQQEGEHLDQVQVTDEAKVMTVALYRAHFLYYIKFHRIQVFTERSSVSPLKQF